MSAGLGRSPPGRRGIMGKKRSTDKASQKAASTRPMTVTEAAMRGAAVDFDDTIACNRGIQPVDPEAIPSPPAGFRATDPDERARRLRRLASHQRAEAIDALYEASGRDLQADLG